MVAAQDFFANLSISLFHNRSEAVELLDGVMVDGTSWSGPSRLGPNVSAARYERLFDGKMAMLAKLQANLVALNGHSEVHGTFLRVLLGGRVASFRARTCAPLRWRRCLYPRHKGV